MQMKQNMNHRQCNPEVTKHWKSCAKILFTSTIIIIVLGEGCSFTIVNDIDLRMYCPLQWHQNGRDGVSNHQPYDCLLNRLFRRRSQKTSKLRVTGLCAGNSPVTGEFSAQLASNAANVSIWWRHHTMAETDIFWNFCYSIIEIFRF